MSNEATPQIPFELQSLASAYRYQAWLSSVVDPFLGRRILELGSGIGNLSQHLPQRDRLILSDIEPSFIQILEKKFAPGSLSKVSVRQISASGLSGIIGENLDTIVSFNVLEHVEKDSALLAEAIGLLKSSSAIGPKRIVSLVPAHQWAFGAIDRSFGHFRRYSDRQFRVALQDAGANQLTRKNYFSRYMNIPALLAWWLKGRVFASDQIGSDSMKIFEMLCPVVRPVDDFLHKVLRLPFGNSLVTVYRVDSD